MLTNRPSTCSLTLGLRPYGLHHRAHRGHRGGGGSEGEARQIYANDPAVRAGIGEAELHPFRIGLLARERQ